MPRPREFDEQQAVYRAMRAFWSHGYEGTSTRELCAVTGLGRSSIYKTFSSKRELFLRSLDHYCDMAYERRMAALAADGDAASSCARCSSTSSPRSSRTGTAAAWRSTPPRSSAGRTPEPRHGCGATPSARSACSPTACARGRREGAVDRAKDAATLARFPHATIAALRLMSRGRHPPRDIEAAAEVALDAVLR